MCARGHGIRVLGRCAPGEGNAQVLLYLVLPDRPSLQFAESAQIKRKDESKEGILKQKKSAQSAHPTPRRSSPVLANFPILGQPDTLIEETPGVDDTLAQPNLSAPQLAQGASPCTWVRCPITVVTENAPWGLSALGSAPGTGHRTPAYWATRAGCVVGQNPRRNPSLHTHTNRGCRAPHLHHEFGGDDGTGMWSSAPACPRPPPRRLPARPHPSPRSVRRVSCHDVGTLIAL